MADLSDVENALVVKITTALFPGTLPTQLSISPVTGTFARIFRGIPASEKLEADMSANVGNVSVMARDGMTRNTTRFAPVWNLPAVAVQPTLTASVSGTTVTYGGTGGAGQVTGVLIGQTAQSSLAYAYRVLAGDTPATVAAAIAALVPGASATGAVLTVPAGPVVARVMADATGILETARQEQVFAVTCWCPTPSARDTLASAVGSALAGMMDANGNLTSFLPLADGSSGYLRPRSASNEGDRSQDDNVWQRMTLYTCDFPTTLVQSLPRMLFGIENYSANGAALATYES